ncbi:hypothetical protein OCB16_24140 [Bacillus cereus]|uniref:type II secretion system F family protein n=1 Tax=Bacillus cereus group TaxID=86661 RepID=UPI000BF7551E|nr:hypothetical protein [Bacillus thuringiensis]MCU5662267.1 hypothetical protein [Bacillus cereus]PFU71329.1 hypothetical protein COK95_07725 [Bacillus thuringiensis]
MGFLNYLPYFLMVVSLFFVVSLVINLIQRKNRSKLIVTTEKDDGKIVKFLKKKGLYKWISPNYIMRESKDFNWNLSLRDYQIILIVGTLVGAVALYGFFMSLSTTIFGVLVGVSLPPIIGFYKRKRYEEYVENQLMVYLEAVANAVSTHENMTLAFKSVLPLLQSPIKDDVERCLILYTEDGKGIKDAFYSFVQKYNYKDIKLFHDMLDLISKTGKDTDDILLNIAHEFQDKKIYRAKLKSGMQPQRKTFKQTAIMLASLPVAALAINADDYVVFARTLQGRFILLAIIVVCIVSAFKIEKHSFYDPTEDITKIK